MSALASLLNHAAARVPRYRGLKPELASFPVLDKRQIRDDLAAHLSDELGAASAGLLELLLAERLPRAGHHDYLYGSKIYIEETSGSSGIPFRTPKTAEERNRLSFGIWLNRRKHDPLFTPQTCYPFDHAPPNLAVRGNPNDCRRESVDQLYENLTAAGIRWVHARAQTLCRHAEVISESVVARKSVCFAENTGYTLSAEDRRFIGEKLRVSLVDQYACREVWAIGTRADDGPFTVLAENVVVELLDAGGAAVPGPGIEGRIVVTGLHQRLFPLIRYDTGDWGKWEGAAAGRRLRLAEFRRHNVLQVGSRQINGNDFTRSVLKAAHKVIGYSRLNYVQVRQLTEERFALAVGHSARARALCDEVNTCWNSRFPRQVTFDLIELTDAEIENAAKEKPDLFTTKYLLDNRPAPPA